MANAGCAAIHVGVALFAACRSFCYQRCKSVGCFLATCPGGAAARAVLHKLGGVDLEQANRNTLESQRVALRYSREVADIPCRQASTLQRQYRNHCHF